MTTTPLITETNTTATADAIALTRRADDLKARINHLRTADIQAADHRLNTLWRTTGELATDHDMCGVYDTIVKEHGGTPREREFYVGMDVEITSTVYININVTARDADEAEEIARHNTTSSEVEQLVADAHDIGIDFTVQEWEPCDVEEA